MGSRSDFKFLPKKFCCCIKLKHGVLFACGYLIFIGVIQILALLGSWDLGYNSLLTLGDYLCAAMAGFCIYAIKKIKMGFPLKILGCLWIVMTVMTIVSYYESIHDRQEAVETIQKVEEQQKQKMEEIASTIIQSNNAQTTLISTEQDKNDLEEFANESRKQLEDWKQNLSQDQSNIIFGLWNFFKIYCGLCILKLGFKMERKHKKNVFYKLT